MLNFIFSTLNSSLEIPTFWGAHAARVWRAAARRQHFRDVEDLTNVMAFHRAGSRVPTLRRAASKKCTPAVCAPHS